MKTSTAGNPTWCLSWMVSSAVAAGTATKWPTTLQHICCQPDWPQQTPCSPLLQLGMWVIAASWMHISVSYKTDLMAFCFWQDHCEWGCLPWHGVDSCSTTLGNATSYSAQQDDLPLHWHTQIRNLLDKIFLRQWIGWEGTIMGSPHPPNITSLDFFLWAYAKDIVHHTLVPDTGELWTQIMGTIISVTVSTLQCGLEFS
jgi:hypothetical protein